MAETKDHTQEAKPRQPAENQTPEREEPVPDFETQADAGATKTAGTDEVAGGQTSDTLKTAEEPTLAERLAEAESQIAKIKDEFLRALAETENVRRRAARDKADASKYAISSFARDLLSVADNLRRAAGSVDAEARQRDPALEALLTGVEMTEKELLGVLARHGVTPIEAEGLPFDPHVHEAMFEVPDERVPHGTVVQVLERGFMLHDRPLRPSRVGVSRGGPKERPADASQSKKEEATDNVAPFPAGGATAYERRGDQEQGSAGSRFDEKL